MLLHSQTDDLLGIVIIVLPKTRREKVLRTYES